MTTPDQSTGDRRWATHRVLCDGCGKRWAVLDDSYRGKCVICLATTPGERLRGARELAGLTVGQLAAILGVIPEAILRLESGRKVVPYLRRAVCEALGVTWSEIWPDIYSGRNPV